MELKRLQALHMQALKEEQLFWIEKSGIKGITDVIGTHLFYASVKANRKKLITRLRLVHDSNEWTYDKNKSHDKAIEHFTSQLSVDQTSSDKEIINIIPKLVTIEDNAILKAR